MASTYLIPAEEIRREVTIVNSRFIATLAPIASADEARAFIKRIRNEFSDASHNVPAYILGGGNSLSEYCSDDGEPSGTAGRPALTILRGSGLGDAAVVVTRYFGGTLLGTGGLVKAYTEATQAVVRDVPRAQRIPVHVALLAIPYNLLERIRILATRCGGAILDEDFAADVTLTLRFPIESFAEFETSLQELSAGRLSAEIIETSEMLVPVS
ncbi:MAG TPA: YigZ family protein [Anaerolineae bacterium]|jgi:uncharacterized YigZ family protein|nr:YigZ family protein [Anaerolineae bacterium]